MSLAFDVCPMCRKLFEGCPHSVTDVTNWQQEQRLRRIVRDEMAKATKLQSYRREAAGLSANDRLSEREKK